LRNWNFKQRPCSLMFVDKSEAECKLDAHEKTDYLIRDERAEGSMLISGLSLKTRSSKMAERGTLPNKIQISLLTWQCIENCGRN
jgi:hypothetical protein